MDNEIPTGKNHPAVHQAYRYIKEYIADNVIGVPMLLESFASNAIKGNETAKYCLDTLERILENKPVGERYVFGLAWTLKYREEIENE